MKLGLSYNTGSHDYFTIKLDLRKYFTFKYGFVLAGRLYNSVVINTPAFYDYSILGGDRYVRGYFYGRYRDHNLSTVQAELRTPLLWRFGLAFIGGVSALYSDPANLNHVRPNYGLGLRFKLGYLSNFLLVVVVFALITVLSHWWLRHFRFGPFEWLWRSLTYMKFQPMRK